MNERAEESRKVKNALTENGYKSSVRHERGTGWNWIRINIYGEPKSRKEEYEDYQKVLEIAKIASGREKHENDMININFIYARSKR